MTVPTELIVGGSNGVELVDSLDIGSVRLTERCLPTDPPTTLELVGCAATVRALLVERVPGDLHVDTVVGVAGTITTLAALDLGLSEYDPERVHGHRLRAAGVEHQLERLAALPLERRREVAALDPERAPVIVAGAIILRETLAYLGLQEIEVSEHDLLYGAALEAAALPEPVEGDAPPGAYTCC